MLNCLEIPDIQRGAPMSYCTQCAKVGVGMGSLNKPIFVVVGFVLAVVVLGATSITTGLLGWPKKYEIADTFHGWVTIAYSKPDCKAFEWDGIFVVIPVDSSGKGCTSSPMPLGWQYTKFVRVDKNGNQTPLAWGTNDSGMIWAWSNRTPQGGSPFFADVFFVGTADQLKSAWSSQPPLATVNTELSGHR
jgi:hypothetical protein